MTRIVSALAALSVLIVPVALPPTSVASELPALDHVLDSSSLDDAIFPASALSFSELAAISGGAPGWVQGACVVVGGVGTGWALAGFFAKRLAVTVACPTCGAALAVAGFACLLL